MYVCRTRKRRRRKNKQLTIKKEEKNRNELCASDVYDSGFCLFWGHTHKHTHIHTNEQEIYVLSTMAFYCYFNMYFFSFAVYIIAPYMRHFWIFGFQKNLKEDKKIERGRAGEKEREMSVEKGTFSDKFGC